MWTLVSRVSGLVRIVVVAAVLGPTYFANLYQAANNLPNLVYELLTGALFASLVVPALVRHFDRGDVVAGTRLASQFLTLSVVSASLLVVIVVCAGRVVLGVLTAGVPAGALGIGAGSAWLLLGLLMLQVPLYVCVGLAVSVQNACGRFAVAAGAPSVENGVILVVMAVYSGIFGGGEPSGQGSAEVALLGGGTTLAVLLHAAVQWWGARRCGARLVPAWRGWRNHEVWAVVRLAVPSLGYASLSVARYLCLLVVAAAAPGAVVALAIAWAFYNLPLALVGRPVALAALPHLSRSWQSGDDVGYSETFGRTFGLAMFVSVPIGITYALLSSPLAAAITFGEMATAAGRELVRYCLLGISLGVVGQAAIELATQAAYARRDARRPLWAIALRTSVAVAGMVLARALLNGPVVMLALGASVAVSDLAAGAVLHWVVTRHLPRPTISMALSLTRAVVASLPMIPVMSLLVVAAGTQRTQVANWTVVLLVGFSGALVYLVAQWVLRSPELAGLSSLISRNKTTTDMGSAVDR